LRDKSSEGHVFIVVFVSLGRHCYWSVTWMLLVGQPC